MRVVTVQPPQPMYECVTGEGERYTSDSNEGNPRWVPIWGFGRRPHGGHGPRPAGPGQHPHPAGSAIVPIGSTLVRTCFINGLPGFVTLEGDGELQTTALDMEDGKIRAIYVMRNPDKLRHLH